MIVQMDKMSAPPSRDRAQCLYEKHNIEYVLWQLHYRRIEELRAHYNAALNVAGSNSSKVPTRPDHGRDGRVVMEKDEKKSPDIKKGLISCHRCLIYLGDLGRYKGLYGDGDAKTREYAAASSYYLQAASLWPSSGNPHHQLAIVASYSGDKVGAVYRYFRSLAVDNPFMTARDSLIVAFEKRVCSHLFVAFLVRCKGEPKGGSKIPCVEADGSREKETDVNEIRKLFCIRFIRLNGILFTRTSLETFTELLASVSSTFLELLSSVPEGKSNFGADTVDNGLFIVRLVSILVFTVHNVKKEAEGQSYAEIVQCVVLLQNAFTAAFELMGHVLERCEQLNDPSSSYLLPGILVFAEWLACCSDIDGSGDADEKMVAIRSKFWRCCIAFMNKILFFLPISLDDNEDDTCFNNMIRYEDGESWNMLALWEDLELRGFLPFVPAQSILDFSRKYQFATDGSQERMARIKRVLAAGKALANLVKVDQKPASFDSKMKKFVIGVVPLVSGDDALFNADSGMSKATNLIQEYSPEEAISFGALNTNPQRCVEGEEDDEVIVFKPLVTEKQNGGLNPKPTPHESSRPIRNLSAADPQFCGGSVSAAIDNELIPAAFNGHPQISTSAGVVGTQHLSAIHPPSTSKWPREEAALLANSMKSVRFRENGHAAGYEMQKDFRVAHLPVSTSVPMQPPPVNFGTTGMISNKIKVPYATILSKVDTINSSGMYPESFDVQALAGMENGFRRSPISRPVRHLGPPPGFTSAPPKQVTESFSGLDLTTENPLADDYSWLDGYHLPSSTKTSRFSGSTSLSSYPTLQYASINNGSTGADNFPFPAKQLPGS
ncbi:unnamed protein product [Linum tenue]|uniref:Protein SMG7 n=1 Tax=Linum tenue TaxID=586396 RepID=A0AAV0QUC2_9ROSI|nr:unnamed protein product [Linum tenue]